MSNYNTQLFFSVTTAMVDEAGKVLKSVHPDKDGVYKGVPLAVLDQVSRNGKYYEPDSIVNCIVDPRSRFNICLREGSLTGEYGHPDVRTNSQEDLTRLAKIDKTRVSHQFISVYSKKTGNKIVIYGDVKPTGPYGEYLDRDFKNSTLNVGFSLRSLCARVSTKDNVIRQRCLALITFDAEDGCGYGEATKRNMLVTSNEALEVPVTPHELLSNSSNYSTISMESITDDGVLEAFGTEKVTLFNREKLICNIESKTFFDDNGLVSLFHKLF